MKYTVALLLVSLVGCSASPATTSRSQVDHDLERRVEELTKRVNLMEKQYATDIHYAREKAEDCEYRLEVIEDWAERVSR